MVTFEYTQYLIMNEDVKGIQKGKLIGQGAHASIGAYIEASEKQPETAKAWFQEGQRKIVLKASEATILQLYNEATKIGACAYIVRDFGLTQIPANTLTCMAIGPDKIVNIQDLVKSLKLV